MSILWDNFVKTYCLYIVIRKNGIEGRYICYVMHNNRRRNIQNAPAAYFFVYAAQFLRLSHHTDLVAIFVYAFVVNDLTGALAFQPAESRDIDHIAGLRTNNCL